MINTLRAFDQRLPLVSTLICVFGFLLYFLAPLLLGTAGRNGPDGPGSEDVIAQSLAELSLVLAVLIIVFLLGDLKGVHFNTRLHAKRLWVLIPILAYLGVFWIGVVQAYTGMDPEVVQTLMPLVRGVVLATLLVGVFEEFLFRGLVFRGANNALGPVAAFFLSSLIFGSMHYVNVVSGQSFSNTTTQVLHAAGAGLMYCGLMLYLNSIWPSVILHGAWDATVFLFGSFSESATPVDVAVSASASADAGLSLVQYAIFGFEPLFGLLLFWLWFRQRNNHAS